MRLRRWGRRLRLQPRGWGDGFRSNSRLAGPASASRHVRCRNDLRSGPRHGGSRGGRRPACGAVVGRDADGNRDDEHGHDVDGSRRNGDDGRDNDADYDVDAQSERSANGFERQGRLRSRRTGDVTGDGWSSRRACPPQCQRRRRSTWQRDVDVVADGAAGSQTRSRSRIGSSRSTASPRRARPPASPRRDLPMLGF